MGEDLSLEQTKNRAWRREIPPLSVGMTAEKQGPPPAVGLSTTAGCARPDRLEMALPLSYEANP
jgi:hypothetical protein